MPRREPDRAAAPPLRRSTRPRSRGDRRPRRRNRRERRRQGGQERRRLRPGQALLRIAGPPRPDRPRQPPPPSRPASARTLVVPVDDLEDAYRRSQLLHFSTLVPSAVDLAWRGGGSFLAVLFEGSERAVASQIGAARELVGGEEGDEGVWDDVRDRQARALGRLSFPPRGLVQTLAGEDDALVRPRPGRPTCRARCRSRSRRAHGCSPSGSALHSIPTACLPDGQGARQRMRPLRLLPAHVPDVRALERGDGLAARAHLPDGGPNRRDDATVADRRSPLRPLPRLHGVRDRLPVGRQVRPADRAHAGARRADDPAPARRASAPLARLQGVPPSAADARRARPRAARPATPRTERAGAPPRDRAAVALVRGSRPP